MKLTHVTLLFILGIQANLAFTQARFSVGINTAIDYVLTPEIPIYKSNGYGNQFRVRYGLNLAVELLSRFRVGIDMDKYSRKEEFDCVYFPTLNNPPQRAWHPLFNNTDYGCQYRVDSRVNFLEIPITVYYDFWKNDNYMSYFGVGYGLQFLTQRTTRLIGLQINEELNERENSFFLMSSNSIRFCLGGERKVSQKAKLGVSLIYRADSFRFEYQSFGLNTGIRLSI